ncbi:hypothetical protein B0T26DRAFT_710855 [Lasiosphaeria miniovina]|uniref:Uncharacterized protein n=1 Tax=Lasiosphaeria miniovina TaxID=1954250 RepID=A0AA40AL15_9PEZI|nr:uncharacterized protein B0T26DRAFT_710855 [Lasiosphaeria miniovina]KAK0717789.1 hypothetical protein B0T26DRAFT_710855 [Lasiosphaeria miniovina]
MPAYSCAQPTTFLCYFCSFLLPLLLLALRFVMVLPGLHCHLPPILALDQQLANHPAPIAPPMEKLCRPPGGQDPRAIQCTSCNTVHYLALARSFCLTPRELAYKTPGGNCRRIR